MDYLRYVGMDLEEAVEDYFQHQIYLHMEDDRISLLKFVKSFPIDEISDLIKKIKIVFDSPGTDTKVSGWQFDIHELRDELTAYVRNRKIDKIIK
jgi:hypothetical protein